MFSDTAVLIVASIIVAIAWSLHVREKALDRRLVCQVVPKILPNGRTWKLRICNNSELVATVDRVSISARMAVSVHAEHVILNAGHLMLTPGERLEFDLSLPMTTLFERLLLSGRNSRATLMDVTIEVCALLKSKKRRRAIHCATLCQPSGVVDLTTL